MILKLQGDVGPEYSTVFDTCCREMRMPIVGKSYLVEGVKNIEQHGK